MTADTTSSRITVPQRVLPLPGHLDDTPVFFSNSPEVVLQSGVLLSTFAADEESSPEAHLDFPLSGRFDVFFHHIADATKATSPRTLYLGLLVGNSSADDVNLRVLNATSYLTRPDAPFTVLNPAIDNDDAKVYAGPGDRVMLDVLCDSKQKGWDDSIILSAHETKVLCSLPIPVNSFFHQLNGRSGFISLLSDGPLHLALLAAFAEDRGIWPEREPELKDWMHILKTGSLVEPRDKQPTPLDAPGELIYGRTAGVAKGAIWRGSITNDDLHSRFSVEPGETVSFPISTVHSGTLGTDQIQTAPLMVRYPDSAYLAHGNYGVLYDLTVPIYNPTESELLVGLSFQSPLKSSSEATNLRFFKDPPNTTVFRGNIKFHWKDKDGQERTKLIHLVQKQGQMQDSLIEFVLSPGELTEVNVNLRYPADCTPPHVLTVSARDDKKESQLRHG